MRFCLIGLCILLTSLRCTDINKKIKQPFQFQFSSIVSEQTDFDAIHVLYIKTIYSRISQ